MNATETKPGTYKGLTAQEWKDKASDSEQRARDSFERCDTDGFLSQWASGKMASEYRLCARLAENDGKYEFDALFDLDGNHVPTRLVDNQYGWSWALLDPANPNGRFLGFVNPSHARNPKTRRANMAKKGYTIGKVLARATVETHGTTYFNCGVHVEQREFFDVTVIETDILLNMVEEN